jgi:hypothetical protein
MPCEWTAWVIDDSWRRGKGTEYRIAVSAGTVTFFPHGMHATLREAKVAAIERTLDIQSHPLASHRGYFSKFSQKS